MPEMGARPSGSVRDAAHARELMHDAIKTGDTSELEDHLLRLSSDATERAFAIMLGCAGRDMSIKERFMAVMMAYRLLVPQDVVTFARMVREAASEAGPTTSTAMKP